MNYVFINKIEDKQISIKGDFAVALQDISMATFKGSVEEWYEDFNRTLATVRSTLNNTGSGGTLNDMSLYLAIKHADTSFMITAYDAYSPPGGEPDQFTVLSSKVLVPSYLVQSALYELAEGEQLASVCSRLQERLDSSIQNGMEILGNANTLLTFYNKNSFTSLGNRLHGQIFSYAAADFVERDGANTLNANAFVKALPEKAVEVFLEMAKSAYPEIDVVTFGKSSERKSSAAPTLNF